jgi:serine/threonine-protein kinase
MTDELLEAAPPRASLALVELPPATATASYRAELPAFSDLAGKGLRLTVDSVPEGLAFVDIGDGKGVIEGTPAHAGSAAMHVLATDHAGRTAQMTATLVIEDRSAALTAAVRPVPPAEARLQPTPQAQPDQNATPAADTALPPEKESRLEAPLNSADRERLFVQSYQGGDCFLVKPVPGERAYLGFGDQSGPFQRFEEAFKQELGAEPNLSLRLITAAECPTLDLIRASVDAAPGAPRVELVDFRVGRNRPLSGKIVNLAGRHAYLLLVDNDGVAYRLDAKAEPGSDTAPFSVPLTPDAGSTGPLQVVMAIVSANPIPALETFRSGPLKALAPPLVEAARAGSASVGAEFIKFDN